MQALNQTINRFTHRTAGHLGIDPSITRLQLLIPALGLSALAAVLFAIGLDTHEIGRDEAVSILLARRPVGELLALLANNEPNPAGHFLLLHFWAHDTALQARLLSYLPAIVVPPLIFVVARRLALPAWTAGLLAAASPFLAYHAEEARPYAWLVLAGTVALAITVRLVQPDAPASVRWSVALGLVLAAGLYLHYFGAFTGVAVATALLVWRQYRNLAVVVATGAVAYVPGAVMLAHQAIVLSQNLAGGWQTRVDASTVIVTFSSLFAGTGDYAPGIVLATFFIACGALAAWRWSDRPVRLLAIFLAGEFVLPLAIGVAVPFLTPRYLAASLPVLLLLTATGVRRLPRRAARAMTLFLLLGSAGLVVDAASRFDGQKLQIREAIALAHAERAHPVVQGYLFAPPAAFYGDGQIAYSFGPPRLDYFGLFALPPGASYPPRDRAPILFFDYCDLPPTELEGYVVSQRTAYPGQLCLDLATPI